MSKTSLCKSLKPSPRYSFMVKNKFLKIACPRCSNAQIVFGAASIEVKCNNCGYLLNKSRGGKSKMRAKVKEILI